VEEKTLRLRKASITSAPSNLAARLGRYHVGGDKQAVARGPSWAAGARGKKAAGVVAPAEEGGFERLTAGTGPAKRPTPDDHAGSQRIVVLQHCIQPLASVASVLPSRFSLMSIWGKIVSVVSAKAVRASIERAVIGAPQALCWCG
jgi:hypothetical protein